MNFKRFNGSTWETVRHKIYGSGTDSLTAFPAQIQAAGEPLTDYLISGNTVQNGTPTPEAPVDVVGCGVRTGNLFDKTQPNTITNKYLLSNGEESSAASGWVVSAYIPVNGENVTLSNVGGNLPSICAYDSNMQFVRGKNYGGTNKTTISISGCSYIRFSYVPLVHSSSAMLNLGSTALPYEPYGYKLPLTVNGTEHPIYLGQVEATRRIKKLVLTGKETIPNNDGASYNSETSTDRFVRDIPLSVGDNGMSKIILCTHLGFQAQSWVARTKTGCCIYCSGNTMQLHLRFDNTTLGITQSDTSEQRTEKLKAYLAAQYAAGTPVTVWYVLAEPETGIVNEPLHKIGDYADTITMAQAGVTIPTSDGDNTITFGTTVQPSGMSATFKGWHPVQGAKVYDGNDWR